MTRVLVRIVNPTVRWLKIRASFSFYRLVDRFINKAYSKQNYHLSVAVALGYVVLVSSPLLVSLVDKVNNYK
jgi:hypothetical protein